MRARRPGLELGMELDGQIPGMARQLGDLDELAVWRSAGDPQPVLDERAFVRAVELVAVTMTLVDQMDAVYALGERAWRELAGVAAKAHGAAEVVDTQQVSQLVNHFGRRVRGALGRIGIGQAGDMTRKLDRRPLESVADSEIRDPTPARTLGGLHHAACATGAEAARHQNAVGVVEQRRAAGGFERLGL